MFDTPDMAPLCLAPYLTCLGGCLAYLIGWVAQRIIQRKTGKEPTEAKGYTWLAVFIVSLAVCYGTVTLNIGVRSPPPWFQPGLNDIVGRWKLSTGSAQVLETSYKVPPARAELVFNADNTFQLYESPSFWGLKDKDRDTPMYITGNGTWTLGQLEGEQRLEWVLFTRYLTINNETDNRKMRFYFEGYLPPYSLIAMDNDNYVRYRFNKQ